MHMMDAAGKLTLLRPQPAPWHQPRFSPPDGRRLAVTIDDDIWIHEPDRGLTQLTLDSERDHAAVWAPPDGRRIAFASSRTKTGVANLYWMQADGSGAVDRLTDSPHEQTPFSFHPSGRHLAFAERTRTTSGAICILQIEGDESSGWKPGKPWTFVDTRQRNDSDVLA